MIRPAFVLGAALTAFALPLDAQTTTIGPNDIRRLRPESCAMADSLAGGALTRPKESAYGYWKTGRSFIISNDPFALTAPGRVSNILLTAMHDGEAGDPAAWYSMQVRFVDNVLREGSGTKIVLFIDDSLRLDLGEADATSTPWSREGKIDQVIVVSVPPVGVRAMMRAHGLRGTVGPTEFVIPPKTQEAFRSVFIAASCGTRLH